MTVLPLCALADTVPSAPSATQESATQEERELLEYLELLEEMELLETWDPDEALPIPVDAGPPAEEGQ